jgi:hypothetical protein
MATRSRHVRTKARASTQAFQGVVFQLISAMEEPLQEATQLVHLLTLTAAKESDDQGAVAFVATKIEMRLHDVAGSMRGIFAACRGPQT